MSDGVKSEYPESRDKQPKLTIWLTNQGTEKRGEPPDVNVFYGYIIKPL